MDLGPSQHAVVIERHGQTTDATGWTTDAGRTQVWSGRGTFFPASATVQQSATGSDSGQLGPTSSSDWVIILPALATAAAGDIAVIDGQDYAVGRVVTRRGVVASLDHLRLEVIAL
jgi:hypothetical protein